MGSKAGGNQSGSGDVKEQCWGVGSIRILGSTPEDSEVFPLYFMVDNQPVQQEKWYPVPESNMPGQTLVPVTDTKSVSMKKVKPISPTKTSKSKLKVKFNSHTLLKQTTRPAKRGLKRQTIPVKGITPPDDLEPCSAVPSGPNYTNTTKDAGFGQKIPAVFSVPLPKPASSSVPKVFVTQIPLCENPNREGFPKCIKIEKKLDNMDSKSLRENKMKHICPYSGCEKSFKTRSQCVSHMQVHANLRQYKCDFCGKGFNTKPSLYEHRKLHSGKKPFKCKFCDQRFRFCGNRNTHERTHTGEKPYVCEFCERRFALRSSMIRHRRVHTQEAPYVCQFCGRACRQYQSLKNHIDCHHHDLRSTAKIQIQPKSSVTYCCTMCGETFDYPSVLEAHKKKHYADPSTVSQIKTELSDENPLMYRVLEGNTSAEPVMLMREDSGISKPSIPLSSTTTNCERDKNMQSNVTSAHSKRNATSNSGIRENSGKSVPGVNKRKSNYTTYKNSQSTDAPSFVKDCATTSIKGKGIENSGSDFPVPLRLVTEKSKSSKRRGKNSKMTLRTPSKTADIHPVQQESLETANPTRHSCSNETPASPLERHDRVHKKKMSSKVPSSSSVHRYKVPSNKDPSEVFSSPRSDKIFRRTSSPAVGSDEVLHKVHLSESSSLVCPLNDPGHTVLKETSSSHLAEHDKVPNAKKFMLRDSNLNQDGLPTLQILNQSLHKESDGQDIGFSANAKSLKEAYHSMDETSSFLYSADNVYDNQGSGETSTSADAEMRPRDQVIIETLRLPGARLLPKSRAPSEAPDASSADADWVPRKDSMETITSDANAWPANRTMFETMRLPCTGGLTVETVQSNQDSMVPTPTDQDRRFSGTRDSGTSVHEVCAPDFGTFMKSYQNRIIDKKCSVFFVRNDNSKVNDDTSVSATVSMAGEHAPIVYDTDVMRQSFKQADSESTRSSLYTCGNHALTLGSFHKHHSHYVYDFATHAPINYTGGSLYHSSDNSNYLIHDTTNALTYDAVSWNNPQYFLQQAVSANGQYVYIPNTRNLKSNTAPSRNPDIAYSVAQPDPSTRQAIASQFPSIECFLPQLPNSQNQTLDDKF